MAFQVQVRDDTLSSKVSRVVHKNAIPDRPSISVCTLAHTYTITEDYAGAQTNTAIITPPSGYRVCIHHIYTSTDQNTVDTVFDFLTSGIVVYKLYVSKQQAKSATSMNIRGAVNEVLSVTCGAKTFVLICYTFCGSGGE